MSPTTGERHKWALDLAQEQLQDRQGECELSAPPGYMTKRELKRVRERTRKHKHGQNTNNQSDQVRDVNFLKNKSSWDTALQPIYQIFMNLFFMLMAGNSISYVSVMMVGMMFKSPLQALVAIKQTFETMKGDQAPIARTVYIGATLLHLVFAIYQCHRMGVLPIYPSDWLAFVEPQQRIEWSGGGVMF